MNRKPRNTLGFRASHADNKRAIQSALGHLAAASGMPTPAEQLSIATARPKRERGPNKPRTADMGKPESEVQNEIIDYLVRHPQVALLERINSGSVYNASGAYIEFHHIYVPHQFKKTKIERVAMRVSDLHVVMTDGRKGVFECKEELWLKISNDREREQDNYIQHIIRNCGFGGFVNSVNATKAIFRFYGYTT